MLKGLKNKVKEKLEDKIAEKGYDRIIKEWGKKGENWGMGRAE